jgi:hypothetical protein
MEDSHGMNGQYPDEVRFSLPERQRRKILFVIPYWPALAPSHC